MSYPDWRLWLLLEYCHNGDMKHFLIGKRAQLRAAIAGTVATDLDARLFLRWAHGIAKGMEYLASKRIMHGDLAARCEDFTSQFKNQIWSINRGR